ncbi:ATP-binding protein [uncultured Draconibacterium sp.]|uniref:AAA family ATPase n=1 Tax=uncultured Draconibacterium sp. TaxID=1573823 RepID=UPI002AA7D6B2|nr:ATP-binding protein [uncultured Draconibacterium sp.]
MTQINVGKPVLGSNFIGRQDELNYLTKLIQMNQNVVIIAPRRYGKTSLILEALRQLENEKLYSAFIDIFSTPTLESLSSEITKAVLKNHKLDEIFAKSKNSALAMIQNLKLKTVVEDFEFILGFPEKKENDWELLWKSIDFIDQFPGKHKKRMICVFDEFGDVGKLDGNQIVKLFRSKIQLHNNTSYIFSGSYESVMSGLFIEKQAPFFRFARIINLGKMDKNIFLEFYKKQLAEKEIFSNENFLLSILDFTDGHPYYSQLALQELIIFHALNKKLPTFDELIERLLLIEKNYLEKSWEEISSRKELVKTVLAVCGTDSQIYSVLKGTGINTSRALKTLEMNGTILKEGKKYEMSDPLFALWIQLNLIKKT